jgi:hypothetical protein
MAVSSSARGPGGAGLARPSRGSNWRTVLVHAASMEGRVRSGPTPGAREGTDIDEGRDGFMGHSAFAALQASVRCRTHRALLVHLSRPPPHCQP